MKRVVFILDGQGFVSHFIDDDKLKETLDYCFALVKDAEKWVVFNDCTFKLNRLQGFYVTDTGEESFKNQSKMADAARKIADSLNEGDDWKKKEA